MSDLTLAFPTLAGLEEVLADELTDLGLTDVEIGRRVVTGTGDLALVYRANLELRTALRVLINIDAFRVDREQELYDRLRATNWRQYLMPEGSLYISVVDPGAWFRNTHYIAQLAKDAIVDQFRDKYQTRPSVDKGNPDLSIHLRISGDGNVDLSVDTSGDGLHRRGYRRRTGEAPINEVLAAGMLRIAGYSGEQPLVDPMCGSGTILAEATMIATNRPPGMNRAFGFQRWPDFDEAQWDSIRKAASDRIQTAQHPILGADIDDSAIAIARDTLERAGVLATVELRTSPFAELQPLPVDETVSGLLITNPPYEMRMQTGDIVAFYTAIGDTLKQQWAGYTAWLISANAQAVKRVGLRTSRKVPLMNGPVEARFCKYELYLGTRQQKSSATD
ncbi:Ribosomal RNA large subunit methyltransferase L [Neolewinella maritima]|uniref:Ribosomal RNA large subunit methyltransferase L n=1 Tax=Neolewinella maritima TaxID=1383882 RepID=A0ABN8F5Z6_9BACT|nr:THUMP domain-containing protein [Neolewinella maritima]CAH1000367.1 Ribosomal RNA large subunit methyltransferase L [Neolewinella maritima]